MIEIKDAHRRGHAQGKSQQGIQGMASQGQQGKK
jgi:hypothetical protein